MQTESVTHFKESYFLRGEWVDDMIYGMLDKDWCINKQG